MAARHGAVRQGSGLSQGGCVPTGLPLQGTAKPQFPWLGTARPQFPLRGTARSSTGLRGGSTLLRSCDGKLVFLAALRASNILEQFPSRSQRTCVSLVRPSATVSSLAVPCNVSAPFRDASIPWHFPFSDSSRHRGRKLRLSIPSSPQQSSHSHLCLNGFLLLSGSRPFGHLTSSNSSRHYGRN